MTASQPNLIARGDTFLGVCEALGEDFGFNPLYLRAALGIGLIWNPLAMIGAYLGLGIVVAFSRLVAPNPRRKAAPQPAAEQRPAQVDNDTEALAVAA